MKLFGLDVAVPPLPPIARAGIFLAIAVAVSVAVNLNVIHGTIGASASAVRAHLDSDAQRIQQRLKQAALKIEDEANVPRLTSTPVFIDRIGQLAGEHGAPVQSIKPHPDKPDHFQVELRTRYHDFEGFIAALEQLDVELVAFDAEITDRTEEDPAAIFRIELLPNNNARQLDIPRLADIRQRMALPHRRNPFQRIGTESGADGNRIDLSDILVLSGIATLGDLRIATIDRQDYAVGDRISGREITRIDEDRVLMRRDDPASPELFILRFRAPGESDGG